MRTFVLLMMLGCAGPGQSLRKADAVLIVECDVASASVYVAETFAVSVEENYVVIEV